IEAFVGRNVRDVPGAGAAGGLGAGLIAFLDARLRSGAELVLDATKFASRVHGADLVVTGEGRADVQGGYGKLTEAVSEAARHEEVFAEQLRRGNLSEEALDPVRDPLSHDVRLVGEERAVAVVAEVAHLEDDRRREWRRRASIAEPEESVVVEHVPTDSGSVI